MLKNEVESFEGWLKLDKDEDAIVPAFISSWTNSWKKSYAAYLLDQGKEILYPPASVVTNFGDAGEHHKTSSSFFQSPLMGRGGLGSLNFNFIHTLDVHLEYSQEFLHRCDKRLQRFDLEVDLCGGKKLNEVNKPYLLSVKQCNNPELQWTNNLKPVEYNLLFQSEGQGISLGRTKEFETNDYSQFESFIASMQPPKTLRFLTKYWAKSLRRFIL
jgi:hypothetical protein